MKSYKNEAFIEFIINDVSLIGDFLIEFYNNSLMKKVSFLKILKFKENKEKMFQAWFNTSFFDQNGMMIADKFMLDKACKVSHHLNIFFLK